MAAASVFATYELLETILLELPLRQLLLAERVNKACCDVVRRSSNIQKALFLAPNSETAYPTAAPSPLTQLRHETTKWYSASEEEGKKLRSLRQEHERYYVDRELDRLLDIENAEMLRALERDGMIRYVRPIVNPFLTVNHFADAKGQDLNPRMETDRFLPSRKGCGVVFARSHYEGGKYDMNACDPSEKLSGSWECMFATQPPVSSIRILLLDSEKRENMSNCLWDLFDACEMSRDYAGRMGCYLYHSQEWVHTAADVDSITGYEMLEILDMSHEELVDEGLLWWSEDL